MPVPGGPMRMMPMGAGTTSAPEAPAYTSSETSCGEGAMRNTRGRRAATLGSEAHRARVVTFCRSAPPEGPAGARAGA